MVTRYGGQKARLLILLERRLSMGTLRPANPLPQRPHQTEPQVIQRQQDHDGDGGDRQT